MKKRVLRNLDQIFLLVLAIVSTSYVYDLFPCEKKYLLPYQMLIVQELVFFFQISFRLH